MRTLFLFITLVLTFFTAWSQTEENTDKKLSVSLSVGPSIPQGDFANKDLDSDADIGLANTGYFIDVKGRYKVSKSIGIMAMVNISRNRYDTKEIMDALSPFYTEVEEFYGGSWQLINFHMGLFKELKLDNEEKFFLELHAMIGVTSGKSPQVEYRTRRDYSFASYHYYENYKPVTSSIGLSYVLGTSLKYTLSSLLDISLDLQYFDVPGNGLEFSRDNSDYEFVSNDPNLSGIIFDASDVSNQKVTSIKIGIGVIFKF